jgi:DNA primase
MTTSPIRIPDGFVDELKARIRPSDVIGRKVKLTKKGKEWVGLSPFTAEKTPSFYVNDQKRIFKCFSSGMGGDVINFVMETERLSFMEAVEKLAEEAGMSLPKASPAAVEEYDHRKRLQAACEAAAEFFEERLRSDEGAGARKYLEGRGLAASSWRNYRLGYAPDDWRRTRAHLQGLGFTDAELLEAGIIKESDRGGEPYDMFRGRLMFPIPDLRGGIIAFGGRALQPDAKPKYLNSGDTPLFHKSTVLYRYKAAREALGHGEGGGLIVCEGYMDVIAMCEAGFGNAVAPLGTALTEEQLQLIWRAGPEPVMCFDGDRAGLGAAYRALDRALPFAEPGRSVFFVLLPDGMDPDDLIRARGAGAMSEQLSGRLPMSELLWRRERDAEPLDTPERQAGLEARLMAACGHIRHSGVKSAYERDLKSRLRDHLWQLREAKRAASYQNRPARGGGRPGSAQIPAGREVDPKQILADVKISTKGLFLLLEIVEAPEIVSGLEEQLATADFEHDAINHIRSVILDTLVSGELPDYDTVTDALSALGEPERTTLLSTVRSFRAHRLEARNEGLVPNVEKKRRIWQIELSDVKVDRSLASGTLDSYSFRKIRESIAEREKLSKDRQLYQDDAQGKKFDLNRLINDIKVRNDLGNTES